MYQTIGGIQSNLVWLATERISTDEEAILVLDEAIGIGIVWQKNVHELFAVQEIYSGGANWCNRALNTCRCNQRIIDKTVNTHLLPDLQVKLMCKYLIYRLFSSSYIIPSFDNLDHISFEKREIQFNTFVNFSSDVKYRISHSKQGHVLLKRFLVFNHTVDLREKKNSNYGVDKPLSRDPKLRAHRINLTNTKNKRRILKRFMIFFFLNKSHFLHYIRHVIAY